MAAPDYPSDCYEVLFRYSLDQRLVSNRLYYRVVAPPVGTPTVSDVAHAFETNIVPPFLDCVTQDVLLEGIYVRRAMKNTENPYNIIFDGDKGSLTGETQPSNINMIIGIQQHSFGGKHNGHIYICGMPDTAVLNGHLTSAYLAGTCLPFIVALGTNMAGPSGTFYQLGVMMLRNEREVLNPAQFLPAVDINVSLLVGTQRRRSQKLPSLSV